MFITELDSFFFHSGVVFVASIYTDTRNGIVDILARYIALSWHARWRFQWNWNDWEWSSQSAVCERITPNYARSSFMKVSSLWRFVWPSKPPALELGSLLGSLAFSQDVLPVVCTAATALKLSQVASGNFSLWIFYFFARLFLFCWTTCMKLHLLV